jgi:predicted secreted hydrolase
MLLLACCPPGGAVAEEWRSAEPGWKYEFPRDHGPHRAFKTEWWYATGNLVDQSGREFGFQLTFFREGIHPGEKPMGSSRFRIHDLPFAHFAVSDIREKTFRFFEKSSRGAFGEAGFATPGAQGGRIAWIEDWVLEELPDGCFHLKGSGEGRAIDMTLTPPEGSSPLIHGKDGISPKSLRPGHASHYYSLTRLRASGVLTIEGKDHEIRGIVWFDHEWATNSLEPGEAGWDWSGLHLGNGSDLMLFRIRDAAGKEVFSSGTLRSPDGRVSPVTDLVMQPGAPWKSPHSGGSYPSVWEIAIPSRGISLKLVSKLQDQELLLSPFAYWEGAVAGKGSVGDTPVTAEGYLEMTGYGGRIRGVNGQ